ncbi:hypothetical protein BH10CHL1_BH10CHL1_38640 [soil metagenome]
MANATYSSLIVMPRQTVIYRIRCTHLFSAQELLYATHAYSESERACTSVKAHRPRKSAASGTTPLRTLGYAFFRATATLCYNLGMNRRQLGFIVLVNAVVSLAVALGVVWAVDARRPDPEELAALYTPIVQTPVVQTLDPVVESAATGVPTVPAIQDTQAPTAPTPTVEPGEQQIYVVQAGDSLFAIAERFHVSSDQIMAANEMKDPNVVFSGQRLKIPTTGTLIPDTVTPPAPPAAVESPTAVPPTAEPPTTEPPTAEITATPTALAILQIETVDSPGNLLNEAILIVNHSDQAYNLQGWRLERQDGPAYTFGNVQLFQESSVWLPRTTCSDTNIALYWQQSSPVWQSGAVARLINAQGQQAATYTIP